MLRSVGWLSRDGFAWRRNRAGPCFPAPGAQCHGHHLIRWGIMPFEGSWQDSQTSYFDHGVHEIAESYGSQIALVPGLPKPQLNATFDPLPEAGPLGTRVQTWHLEGEKPMPIAASCKPCEDGRGFAIRLWNPTSNDWNGNLCSDLDLTVESCDMLERVIDSCKDGSICVPAGGIATFRMG